MLFIENLINALRGFESINSDHQVFRFTFNTAKATLAVLDGNLVKSSIIMVQKGRNWFDILCRVASRISRVFCDGLVMEAS